MTGQMIERNAGGKWKKNKSRIEWKECECIQFILYSVYIATETVCRQIYIWTLCKLNSVNIPVDYKLNIQLNDCHIYDLYIAFICKQIIMSIGCDNRISLSGNNKQRYIKLQRSTIIKNVLLKPTYLDESDYDTAKYWFYIYPILQAFHLIQIKFK